VSVPARGGVEPHLQILHAVAESISRSLDVEDVLRTAVEALTRVTGHEISSLHLVADDGRTLLLRGDRGLSPELREVNRVLPVGEGVIGQVAATGQATNIRDMGRSPRLFAPARAAVRRDRIRGFLCVAIVSRGRILGTLSLGRRTPAPFDAREVALVEATAGQIGIALDHARLHSETVRQLEELRRTQAQLIHAAKLSAVGELASGVAHEINNPLTTILGQVHLLLEHDGIDRYTRERLAMISSEASRSGRIIQNLLLFARHYARERRPCSLADQVRRVLELKAYQLKQEGVQVVTEFGDCAPVYADENRIQQVLLNLVQNAQQAMVRQARPRVLTMRVHAGDGGAVVEVLDTGPGIPPDVLPRVFDPFFTTKPPGEGTGLGLSVSYGIVTEHGGRLRVENREDGGARFVVELPIGEPSS
jgi:C4-dicarboxylate-specific signal transduction histidine kinase